MAKVQNVKSDANDIRVKHTDQNISIFNWMQLHSFWSVYTLNEGNKPEIKRNILFD